MKFWKKKEKKNIKRTIYRKNFLVRFAYLIVGLFLSSTAFNLFFLRNDIVYGGVSGLSIITKHFFGIEPSIFIMITSIFLLLLSFILLGKEKTTASILGSLLYPVFVELTKHISHYISINNDDLLLICIFGGIMTGIGFGLIFKAGFTTGGTDILNQIVSKYFHISIGKSALFTDGIIVIGSGFAFGFTKVMYALVVLYIWSLMADRVMLGISSNKCFHIITEKENEVKNYILETLGSGVTVFDAKGGYSGEKEKVLLCVVDSKDYFTLKEGILEIDEKAFFIVTDSYEVIGGK